MTKKLLSNASFLHQEYQNLSFQLHQQNGARNPLVRLLYKEWDIKGVSGMIDSSLHLRMASHPPLKTIIIPDNPFREIYRVWETQLIPLNLSFFLATHPASTQWNPHLNSSWHELTVIIGKEEEYIQLTPTQLLFSDGPQVECSIFTSGGHNLITTTAKKFKKIRIKSDGYPRGCKIMHLCTTHHDHFTKRWLTWFIVEMIMLVSHDISYRNIRWRIVADVVL